MITTIKIENFKSLQSVDLKLGGLNIFMGANAGGKSNFFDALRFLQGIGYGLSINEICNGKPRGALNTEWTAIRGGSPNIAFYNHSANPRVSFHVETEKHRFSLAFSPKTNELLAERLEPRHPAMEQAGESKKFLDELANMQHFDPLPGNLRGYSKAQHVQRMGEHGENFSALVNTLLQKPRDKEAFLSWLKQLRPEEVEDVGTLPGAVGEPLFMIREGGRDFPAPVLSDGTLRFAAIAASLFQPDMPAVLTLEEIENGIHPDRLRLLVELLRAHAVQNRVQIMVTTHSPLLLDWLRPDEYATTFWCRRDEDSGASGITPLTGIPHFNEVVKTTPVSKLLAEGWFGGAL